MTATRVTARGLGRVLGRVTVTGLDRVPDTGGVLIAVNHTALVDGPLVYGILRRPAVFLVKAEVFVGPVGLLLRRIGQVPVRRGTIERAPVQSALGTLAAGGVVGIFPEGTRGAGTVEQVQHGIAYLALRSGCPVVPVACHGTAALLRGRRRPHVRVTFGEPLTVSVETGPSRRQVAAAAEEIRAALAGHVAATRPTQEGTP
jgi:1-acyl-sn-glycerol-3-phosphate acyltransferase